jgi:hypothetical protein
MIFEAERIERNRICNKQHEEKDRNGGDDSQSNILTASRKNRVSAEERLFCLQRVIASGITDSEKKQASCKKETT